ncbi:MBL fold metallo-hydrolase [Streptomyces sp. GS7]|uniref:MBL fold metallo-hydrolase n=1 Tax=Streptomyces sp. GS7 TaxID=2692234 RepID=UPI001316015C|nr:MBL fold metallo-hydrolase [Streptomyces sp. GS7]QHC23910.1 hypothetical protein GR130_23640 [Streptomyces sp. GS7]
MARPTFERPGPHFRRPGNTGTSRTDHAIVFPRGARPGAGGEPWGFPAAKSTDSISRYAAEHFGGFDFSGITVTAPTRTFTGRQEMNVGGVTVELVDLGPGHSAGDVALRVPDDGIVFAGAMLFDGGHMIVWSGSPAACIDSVDVPLARGAETFVPGHGALMGAEVRDFRAYLTEVQAAATAWARDGLPLSQAAARVHAEFAGDRAHPERLFTATAGTYADAGLAEALATLDLVKGMADLARLPV